MRIWVPRPEPGAGRTGGRLRVLGHEPLVAPVLEVRPTGAALPAEPPDAVLLTSANAAEALGAGAAGLRGRPVFAVGARTAALARAAGLGPVADARGDAADLVRLVRARLAPGQRLLHVAGAERKAEPASALRAAGFALTVVIAYAAEPVAALPGAVADALRAGGLDAALHYSRRSATIATERAVAAGLGGAFGALKHYCLSADVAVALEAAGITAHFVPARPQEDDLLAGLAKAF
ncbi:uroporphyrinogen-III synthase [Methylobacterium planeticum]|uniref:Uroporphyrinogen-III synthase n=1 Tax=Methylobacterium planeticum TaxID=2615211 RepID=A0A6N6MM83_9HYPH|nr:uroporphyrinogen-III synthase [Methylobacterium planeticum]KAB1070104.1 uroporphyrinogen-III synthase [Methylobacterium planeticum]